MIRLVAMHLDAYGHVRFTIHVDDVLHATTDEALEAARVLHDLGVQRPLQCVSHAREWGFVEMSVASWPGAGSGLGGNRTPLGRLSLPPISTIVLLPRSYSQDRPTHGSMVLVARCPGCPRFSLKMARYRFHCIGPQAESIDEIGLELPDLEAVRVVALDLASELATEETPEHWRGWIIKVADEGGMIVFTAKLAMGQRCH